jgi:3-oxoacyl-[acyl-carrier protein] reductase
MCPKTDPSNPNASVFARQEFEGKNFFLCGASTGIGFAVAEELAKYGANLALVSRNAEKLSHARTNLLGLGAGTVETFSLDFNSEKFEADLKKIIESPKLFKNFEGLLLNGGGPHGGKFESIQPENFDFAHNLLFKAPARIFQSLIPHLKISNSKLQNLPQTMMQTSVVSVTSTTVKEPHPDLPLSAAYRTALVALLKNASDDLASHGIRINNVAPGYTATQRLEELKNYSAEKHSTNPQAVEEMWAEKAPQKRIAQPNEIANTVLFLFSRASSFLTGQTIVADGGQTRGYF